MKCLHGINTLARSKGNRSLGLPNSPDRRHFLQQMYRLRAFPGLSQRTWIPWHVCKLRQRFPWRSGFSRRRPAAGGDL